MTATETETTTSAPGTKSKLPEQEAFQTAPGQHAGQRERGHMPHGAAASEHVTVKRVGAAVDDERGGVRVVQAGPGHAGHQGGIDSVLCRSLLGQGLM